MKPCCSLSGSSGSLDARLSPKEDDSSSTTENQWVVTSLNILVGQKALLTTTSCAIQSCVPHLYWDCQRIGQFCLVTEVEARNGFECRGSGAFLDLGVRSGNSFLRRRSERRKGNFKCVWKETASRSYTFKRMFSTFCSCQTNFRFGRRPSRNPCLSGGSLLFPLCEKISEASNRQWKTFSTSMNAVTWTKVIEQYKMYFLYFLT